MGVDPANLICVCGHKNSNHVPECTRLTCSCIVFTLELREPIQPPQVEARRKTPEVVLREIRKFSLEQAIKAIPHIHPSDAWGGVLGVAVTYEDYILNGKQER